MRVFHEVEMSPPWERFALLDSAPGGSDYIICYDGAFLFVLELERGEGGVWGFFSMPTARMHLIVAMANAYYYILFTQSCTVFLAAC